MKEINPMMMYCTCFHTARPTVWWQGSARAGSRTAGPVVPTLGSTRRSSRKVRRVRRRLTRLDSQVELRTEPARVEPCVIAGVLQSIVVIAVLQSIVVIAVLQSSVVIAVLQSNVAMAALQSNTLVVT